MVGAVFGCNVWKIASVEVRLNITSKSIEQINVAWMTEVYKDTYNFIDTEQHFRMLVTKCKIYQHFLFVIAHT